MSRLVFFLLGLAFAATVDAAATAQAVSAPRTSVEAGHSHVFSAKFFDAADQPVAGAVVQFANDACGTFSNGGFQIATTTNAAGVASATFIALSPGGVTCTVTAAADVVFSFDVVTFSLAQVAIDATTSGRFLPADATEIAASVRLGATRLPNVVINARFVPGEYPAQFLPSSANTGSGGTALFALSPNNPVGDYEVELEFLGLVRRVPIHYTVRRITGAPASGPGNLTIHTTMEVG